MAKQGIRQSQQQKISYQQVLGMKILELGADGLEQAIKEELEENPVLKEDTESQHENVAALSNWDGVSRQPRQEGPTFDYGNVENVGSFIEYLNEQLQWVDATNRIKELASFIIGSLDSDGYFRQAPIDIVNDLLFSYNKEVEEKEVEKALNLVQGLDPAGVGARNLQECLLLQLERKDAGLEEVALARQIVEKYFEDLSNRRMIRIKRLAEDELVSEALAVIAGLDPKPGGLFPSKGEDAPSIHPDFIVDVAAEKNILYLNKRTYPSIRINDEYEQLLSNYKERGKGENKKASNFLKEKLVRASWFIDAIKQREQTMLLVMGSILHFQQKFFTTGDETTLAPLRMKDVAEEVGLDISSVSRVCAHKHVETPYGVFPLKHFFSGQVDTTSGEQMSTTTAKQLLSELVEEEDRSSPYSDEVLQEKLKEKGVVIARRTVAKYRSQLGIPVARLRREIS